MECGNEVVARPQKVGLPEAGFVPLAQFRLAVQLHRVCGFHTEYLFHRTRGCQAVHRGGVDPFPAGTLVKGDLVHARGIGLRHHRPEGRIGPFVFLPDHGGVREDALIQRRLHMLAPPALLPADEGGQDACRQQETGRHARSGEVEEHRARAPAGLLILHPRAGLDEGIPTRSITKPVAGRIGRHGAVHEARETAGQLRIRKPQPTHGSGTEGFHHDVGAVTEAQEHLAALAALQVDHRRTSTAIPHVVRGLTAKRVPARWFDLDDIGAHVGQQHDADGAGDAPAEIEHAHSRQGPGGRAHVGVTRLSEAVTSVPSMYCGECYIWA